MTKRLFINCGNALILSDNLSQWEEYDKIILNCGNAMISSKAQQALNKIGLINNSGNTEILKTTGEIVVISGDKDLVDRSYADCYLYSTNSMVLKMQHQDCLQGCEYLHVNGVLYYPAGFDFSEMGPIKAHVRHEYPLGAKLVFRDMEWSRNTCSKYQAGDLIWCSETMTVLQSDALSSAKEKNISLSCRQLVISESLLNTYQNMLDYQEIKLIPDGYEVVRDITLTSGEIALYGDKIYIIGDLYIRQQDVECLSELTSIVVEGCARIPISIARDFRSIGTASQYFLYEGQYWPIDGTMAFSHDMLQAAVQNGTEYTIVVNGTVRFEKDVTAEDIRCIKAFHYNGTVMLEEPLKPVLQAIVKTANGTLNTFQDLIKTVNDSINSEEELGAIIEQLTPRIEDDCINCGNYELL